MQSFRIDLAVHSGSATSMQVNSILNDQVKKDFGKVIEPALSNLERKANFRNHEYIIGSVVSSGILFLTSHFLYMLVLKTRISNLKLFSFQIFQI